MSVLLRSGRGQRDLVILSCHVSDAISITCIVIIIIVVQVLMQIKHYCRMSFSGW